MSTEKYSKDYWLDEINKATDARERFLKEAGDSIAVYKSECSKIKDKNNVLRDFKRKLNCWSFVVNTILPAYYSKVPDIECDPKSDKESSPVLLAALMAEKTTEYQLDEENEIGQVLYHFVSQYILTGIGILWARYEADLETTEEGQPAKKTNERAILESVCYDDYLCSDVRKHDEKTWEARRAFLGKDDAEARFGSDAVKDIVFDLVESSETEDKDNQKRERIGDKAAFWEIWCKESSKVYWLYIAANNEVADLLEESEPPINLKKFYPSSVLICNQSPDSLVPVSDYTLCKDSIIEVERLTERAHFMAEAIRANFVYDASLGDQAKNLFSGDLLGYAVTNKMITGLNLRDSIEYLDVSPYVGALQTILSTRQEALNKVYESTHLSDLMRGISDPNETAKAQSLKAEYTSLGFNARQRQMIEAVSNAYNLIAEIVSEQFSEMYIASISDPMKLIDKIGQGNQQSSDMQPQQMPMPQQGQAPMPQQPQQQQGMDLMSKQKLIFDAIGILKNDFARRFSIRIKSDSMVMLDEANSKAEKMELLQVTQQTFEGLQKYAMQYPDLVDGVKTIFTFVLSSFRGSKEIVSPMLNMFDAVKQGAIAQRSAPQQPNPEMIKAQNDQGRVQAAQMEAQARLMEAQSIPQKVQFDQWERQQKLALEGERVKIEATKVYTDQQQKSLNAELQKADLAFSQYTKTKELEIEDKKVQMTAAEKLIEEQRLAQQRIDEERRHQDKMNKPSKAKKIQRTQDGFVMQEVNSDSPENI